MRYTDEVSTASAPRPDRRREPSWPASCLPRLRRTSADARLSMSSSLFDRPCVDAMHVTYRARSWSCASGRSIWVRFRASSRTRACQTRMGSTPVRPGFITSSICKPARPRSVRRPVRRDSRQRGWHQRRRDRTLGTRALVCMRLGAPTSCQLLSSPRSLAPSPHSVFWLSCSGEALACDP